MLDLTMTKTRRAAEQRSVSLRAEKGLSLVELMIAMAIGLVLTAAVGALFLDVLKSNREQFKAAQQIENGRYAMDVVYNDLQLAGFYGEFGQLGLSTTLTAVPDPCGVPDLTRETETTDSTTDSVLLFHVQGTSAATATANAAVPGSCGTWLTNTVRPGSDILVIRRAETNMLVDPQPGNTDPTATAVAGQLYLQTTAYRARIQQGTGQTIDKTEDATNVNVVSPATQWMRRDFTQPPAGIPSARPNISAALRPFRVHVYYVSKCSTGTGPNGRCQAGDDEVPTLKRLELTSSGGGATMRVQPIAEGIEFFKVQYGLDKTSAYSGRTVDAIPEEPFVTAPPVTDWPHVVAVDVRILARNSELTAGYQDDKSYDLGSFIYQPTADVTTSAPTQFRRTRYQSRIYLANPAGRREF